MSTFPSFGQLPPELRWLIWSLALPERVIKQAYAKSGPQFVSEVPNILHCCHEAREAFAPVDSRLDTLRYQKVEGGRPFYFCSRLDTIYVPRHFENFDLQCLTGLRALQMNWETQPYWWVGSQEGPALLRSFPHLETFTLVVVIPRFASEDDEEELVETARRHTTAVMEAEQREFPNWRSPEIRFHKKKANIELGGESLLPENRYKTGFVYDLYDWAKEIEHS